MRTYPSLRRGLLLLITVTVFGGISALVACKRAVDAEPAAQPKAGAAKGELAKVWPMFGGTNDRNMVNRTDKGIPAQWHAGEEKKQNVKWSARLGTRAYGGPVVGAGKVFVGTNNNNPKNPKVKGDKGIVMCFRESDGEFLWQAIHDKLPSGQVHDWPLEGICSTPLVEGNRVYYVSNRCELVCADTEGFLDGKNDGVQDEKYTDKSDADFIWRLDMMKELNVFPHNMACSCPLIAGDLVFIVTANGVDEGHINVPNPKAPSFIAVSKKTGKVVWQDNSPGKDIMHGQWSNPTYTVAGGKPQIIFPGGDGWLRSFEPDTGKLIWKFDCNPKNSFYKLGGAGTKNDFIATPVAYENKLYIGVGQDPEHYEGVGHLWCIDLVKANQLGGDVSPIKDNFDPKFAENQKKSALVWHYGGHVPKDQIDKVRRDYFFARTMSTCAILDGLVYVGELAGYLHCLDAATGQVYWIHDLKSAVWGSAYYVDGKVMIGTEDGDIYVFAHGKEKKLLNRNEMDHSVKSTPIAVNGVLYVMTEQHLYAIVGQ